MPSMLKNMIASNICSLGSQNTATLIKGVMTWAKVTSLVCGF